MGKSATATNRAPRGTKVLAQAFFSATDAFPEAQRDSVVKAALALIRDQLKEAREKARVAKEKIKAKGAKTPAARKAPARKESGCEEIRSPGRPGRGYAQAG
jgi:hypothetical protein